MLRPVFEQTGTIQKYSLSVFRSYSIPSLLEAMFFLRFCYDVALKRPSLKFRFWLMALRIARSMLARVINV